MQAPRQVLRDVILALFLALPRAFAADDKPAYTNAVWFAENYTKYEHRIPMRDGVRLFTRVYVPKDDSQVWPIILTRTPYALKPYGTDNYTDPSGSFTGDDLHHNGAFFLSQNFNFFYCFSQRVEDPLHEELKGFNFKTPDGYDFYLRMGPLANSEAVYLKGRAPIWSEFLAHPTYDAYWQARNIRPHLKNVRCAVMTVGGWFDGEDLFGPLETYRWTERQNPGITNLLVMGPWAHGDWGSKAGDK